MGKNYYELLELSKNANNTEIKKMYKKFAIKYHPDKNPDNKEEAENKFKEISEAYQVLIDPDRRELYDNHGEDGLKHNSSMRQSHNFNSADEIFKMFFGGNSIQKTQTKIINIPFTIKESYNGSKKKITLKIKNICNNCNGFGGINIKQCDNCNGTGIMLVNRMIGPGMMQRLQTQCQVCSGMKKISEKICNECNGNKYKLEEKEFILLIEPGIENDDTIVFINCGDELPNEDRGDLVFIFKEENNSSFSRVGNDLIYNYSVSLGDSIIGTTINFNNINGEKICYVEKNMIKENSFTVIKNKGMPVKKQNKFGDLYIIYNINYPNKILSNEEKDIIKKILPTTVINIDVNNQLDVSPIKINFLINDLLIKNGKKLNNKFF